MKWTPRKSCVTLTFNRRHCTLVVFTADIIVTIWLMVIFLSLFLVLVWSTCIFRQTNIMDFILQHFFYYLWKYVFAFDFLNDAHIVSMPYGTNHIFLLLNKICMNKNPWIIFISPLKPLHLFLFRSYI